MADNDEFQNSFPYIDDTLTDDDVRIDKCQYNLRIIENYQNKGRNIEITNTQFDDITSTSLSPVAPLAEETEVSDSQEEEKVECKENITPRPAAIKLIVKGCNSMISIQGLDNKSSITFRRKSERIRREKTVALERRQEICRKDSLKSADDMKAPDKSKKGRWRKLTRSLISKSARFERRTSDERYPKYVLLRNEEEDEEKEHLVKKDRHESYPKMVIFNAKTPRRMGSSASEKQKESGEKHEFSLKRSFKNKTEPVLPKNEVQSQSSAAFDKETVKPLNAAMEEKSSREKQNKITRKRVAKGKGGWEGEQSQPETSEQEIVFDFSHHPVFQGNLFSEIQGILEEALQLYSDVKAPNQTKEPEQPPPPPPAEESQECFPSLPPQICQFSCHDPHYCQPPVYIPVYNQYGKPRHSYRSFCTQTNDSDFGINNNNNNNNNNQNNGNIQFGILSSFFPGAVVMKTFQCKNLDKEMEDGDAQENQIMEISSIFTSCEDDTKTLKVPVPDLTIKSKMVFEEDKQEKKPPAEIYSSETHPEECLIQHQNSNSDEEEKTKADDSEATEYLYYNESESQENESTTTTLTISKNQKDDDEDKGKPDDGLQDLSLTKVGYKMYDSLTKLSLSCRESERTEEKPECGCLVNRTEKPFLNISVESNRGAVKVTIPEEELILRLKNKTEKSEVEIGISKSGVKDAEGKTLVQKNELWHPDNGRRSSDMLVVKKNKFQDGRRDRKDSQKIKLSLDENKEVVLSIEMDEEKTEKEKPMERATKEMKIGTDDIDLAGGDVLCTKGSNYQNLSPRTGQILKSLEEKLTFSERERKILADKIKKKVEDDILERAASFPGLFLVKQICPAPCTPRKPFPVPCIRRSRKVTDLEDLSRLREYYCEECLATMRIFEDENPSVKSMVDKFETIIHLDKY